MTNNLPGNLLTTAMAIMPHTDVDRALETALSLEVPFWPHLPHYSYYEDMYVQAAEHFPGIVLDMEQRTLRFSVDMFTEELEGALLDTVDPPMVDMLTAQLEEVPKLDFIVSHHAEQDHSCSTVRALEEFPEAKVVSTLKAKDMLVDPLRLPKAAFTTVWDSETLSPGDNTLQQLKP